MNKGQFFLQSVNCKKVTETKLNLFCDQTCTKPIAETGPDASKTTTNKKKTSILGVTNSEKTTGDEDEAPLAVSKKKKSSKKKSKEKKKKKDKKKKKSPSKKSKSTSLDRYDPKPKGKSKQSTAPPPPPGRVDNNNAHIFSEFHFFTWTN